MKKMETILLYTLTALLLGLTVFMVMAQNIPTDRKCKEYILAHKDEITKESKNADYFIIPTTEFKYYEDITIRVTGKSSYMVIFWGDRNSIFWGFRRDKDFSVDTDYNEYKGKDTTLDKQILKAVTDGNL